MFMCGAATFPVVLCMQTPAMGGTHISHASVVNARAPHAFRMRVLPESTIDATHDAFVGLLRSKRLLLQLHNQDAERSIAFIANTLGDIAQGNVTRSRHPIQTVLDGTLAGDAHWDPLCLCSTKTHAYVYADAELKHGRLAMLAVAGWVSSELLGVVQAGYPVTIDPAGYLVGNGRAPSLVNGGLEQVPFAFWLVAFGVAALVESRSLERQFDGWFSVDKPWEYAPGDIGFDPLDARGALAEQIVASFVHDDRSRDPIKRAETIGYAKRNLASVEVWHSRMAMVAVVCIVAIEACTGRSIVEVSPFMFGTQLYDVLGRFVHEAHGSGSFAGGPCPCASTVVP